MPDRSLRYSEYGGLLEDVLDLLAGLLEVALGLVALALRLEVGVVGGPARGLLALAGQLVDLVADLVFVAHACPGTRGAGRHADESQQKEAGFAEPRVTDTHRAVYQGGRAGTATDHDRIPRRWPRHRCPRAPDQARQAAPEHPRDPAARPRRVGDRWCHRQPAGHW